MPASAGPPIPFSGPGYCHSMLLSGDVALCVDRDGYGFLVPVRRTYSHHWAAEGDVEPDCADGWQDALSHPDDWH